MKRDKKYYIKKTIIIIFLVIGLILLVFSGFHLYLWYKDYKQIEGLTSDLNKTLILEKMIGNKVLNESDIDPNDPYWKYINMPLISVDFKELKGINKDTIAWIRVENTNINYPVVQAKNNSYYLNHSYNKAYNNAGWIFMDYTNNSKNFDKNTVLYGHARRDKTMFGTLRNIVSKNWYYDANSYIVRMSTPYEDTLWQIFSVYTIKKEDYYIQTKFIDLNSYEKWLNTMIKRSKFNFKTKVSTNDQILTLSSCYTYYDSERVVLQAKLIKRSQR